MYTTLEDPNFSKALKKTNREIVQLHKRCLKHHLRVYFNLKEPSIKKFFIIYDNEINEDNIRYYVNRPLSIFIKALIRKELQTIKDYYPSNEVL